MKLNLPLLAALFFGAMSPLFADQTTASVQQALKDQGFYYGQVDGQKDADTTAAIRRFQIRNGLKITGEIDAETLNALHAGGSSATAQATPATRAPAIAQTPRASATSNESTDTDDLRDGSATTTTRVTPPPAQAYNPNRLPTPGSAMPGPAVASPNVSQVFAATPYEIAPPEVQHHVLAGAQVLLTRRGLYRSGADGVYGPATEQAVRAFQSRSGIPPNGRLDMDTLAALGLLPGQHAPGIAVPARRSEARPRAIPRGDWIPFGN